MNDFDDLLRHAWQTTRPADDGAVLLQRMRRHRLRHRLQRGLEIMLTLAAVALLLRPLAGAAIGPSYWLLMPFFVVYMPVAWWWLLRAPRVQPMDAALDGARYARVRLSQLRADLRELRLARIASLSLLAYTVAAAIVAVALGDAAWRTAAVELLCFAIAWSVVIVWFCHRRRRRDLREYRAMRRLAGRDF
ncbi:MULTISPECIES: hypothetical protein [Luteimonas]|uniref:hypothetical protein n=1 Tax=Luteimonas TaxID=83614 RepID=UPI000C7BD414|nr:MULTISPECIES: hypothetical protein [Luteimonas]